MSDISDEQLEELQLLFDKQYGKNTFCEASSLTDKDIQIIPTTPSLDLVLGGGIPEGSWLTLSGEAKCGKSTLALSLAANAQKQDRLVVYADIEGRIKKKNLLGIKDLDLSPSKFRMIRSTPEKIMGGTEFLNQILSVLENIPRAFIILDSVSALCEKKEMEEGVEAETRGNINKRFSSFCRICGQIISVNSSVLVGITHRIANTSGFGAPTNEKISSALKYQRDISLRIKKKENWVIPDSKSFTGERVIGAKVSWLVEESALGAPGGEVNTWLRFGLGFDGSYEQYELAKAFSLINKAEKGGWVTIPDDKKKIPKFQGDEKCYQFLINNPDIFNPIKDKVMKMLTGDEE